MSPLSIDMSSNIITLKEYYHRISGVILTEIAFYYWVDVIINFASRVLKIYSNKLLVQAYFLFRGHVSL